METLATPRAVTARMMKREAKRRRDASWAAAQDEVNCKLRVRVRVTAVGLDTASIPPPPPPPSLTHRHARQAESMGANNMATNALQGNWVADEQEHPIHPPPPFPR